MYWAPPQHHCRKPCFVTRFCLLFLQEAGAADAFREVLGTFRELPDPAHQSSGGFAGHPALEGLGGADAAAGPAAAAAEPTDYEAALASAMQEAQRCSPKPVHSWLPV